MHTVTGRALLLLICLLYGPLTACCQDTTARQDTAFLQQDIKDWLVHKGWVKPKPEKKNFLLIIPVIASNPTAGVIVGAGLTYAYKTEPTDLHLSTVSANATYSTKNLLNLNVKTNGFHASERLVLNGDWRLLIANENTYGLSTEKYISTGFQLNGYSTSRDTLGESLDYNQIRLHESISWRIIPNFYVGVGIYFDHYYNIEDEELLAGDTLKSYQYQYSVRNDFNPKKYTTTGIGLNVLYDSRDNQVNAYKGYYANFNFRINPKGLGSAQSSTILAEYRSYHAFSRGRFPHVLGLWLYGNFVVSGKVPYLQLPALGYDQRQRTGRGYTFGRFRGVDLLYAETEYRFPVSRRTGILGRVLFINTTTASDQSGRVKLLEYFRIGYGGGLRVMLDKKSRTRLQIDAGIAGRTVGFYFGAQETF